MSNPLAYVLLGALGAIAPAQTQSLAAVEPRPLPAAPLAHSAVPTWPVGAVLTDRAADGTLWAAAATWKASFGTEGVAFVPWLGSQAPRNLPTRFALRCATVNGTAILAAAGPATLSPTGSIVSFARGPMHEDYVLTAAGIEQQFHFDALPQRGTLRLELAVASEFAVAATDTGHRFTHALGTFEYGRAVALDSRGARCPVPVVWDGSALALTVPAEFVAAAKLPLVVDPLIGNVVTLPTANTPQSAACIAYDASLQQYIACYERAFSLTDSDVYLQRFNASLQPIDLLAADLTGVSWRKCRIANLEAYDRFLTVAEVSNGNAGISWVGGRILDAATATHGPQFQISAMASSCRSPDVGGDGNPATPTYFTVVYENVYAANDRDVYLRQVAFDGTLRTNQVVANSTDDEHSPAISRTDGWESFQSQFWTVAWRREWNLFGQTWVANFDWNGNLRTSGSPLAAPAMETLGSRRLALSSPTLANQGRRVLVCDTTNDASNGPLVRGAVVDGQLNLVAPLATLAAAMMTEPSADTDGVRFALAYTSLFGNWPNVTDRDVVVRTFGLVGNHLVQQDETYVAYSGTEEFGPSICSTRVAAGAEYALAWSHDLTATSTRLEAVRYRGTAAGGVGIRSTGCGPLTWSFTGDVRIGASATFTLAQYTGLCGWAIGFPTSAPVPNCPSCVQGTSALGTALGAVTTVSIPAHAAFVGTTLALQGFDFGGGPCLGAVSLSHTADLLVR